MSNLITPLMYAASQHKISLLPEGQYDVRCYFDSGSHHIEVLEKLLENGADINAINKR